MSGRPTYEHPPHAGSYHCQTSPNPSYCSYEGCCIHSPLHQLRMPGLSSMHELEEGNLAWSDSTQWALNRLSASQVSLISSHSAPPSQKKLCKYFNEGSCTHEGHHGLYKHNCSFCGRQGRTSNHPESKCNFKSKKQEKTNTLS